MLSVSPQISRGSHCTIHGKYIAFAGLIGAGKSYMSEKIGNITGLPVYTEPQVGTVELENFYKFLNATTPEAMNEYVLTTSKELTDFAFTASNGAIFQFYLMSSRLRQIIKMQAEYNGVITDRTLLEDEIFARMLRDSGRMSPFAFATYKHLARTLNNIIKSPDIIVFLDVTPETALNRIECRGRDCERGITLEYLTALYGYYQKFIQKISHRIQILRVNYEDFRTEEEMIEHIANSLMTSNITDC